MDKIDPDAPTEHTFESYWQSYIDDARAGDTRAARQVMGVCIRFLRGNDFPETTGIENRPGFVPEPLSSYLAKTLAAAMAVPSKEVGIEMGMGNPEKPPRNEAQLIEFMDRYSSLVHGEIPKDPARHAQVLKDVARQMDISRKSVWIYWSELKFELKEFGLPPPVYEADADLHQRLEIIINQYRSLIKTPIKDGNTTRRRPYSVILIKISKQTGENHRIVERYLEAIHKAAADIFKIPKSADLDEELLNDLATFISLYNSIMNSPVDYNGVTLPRRRKRAAKQIMSHMGNDLPSVKRYWKTVRRAAELIKAPQIADED